MLSVDHHRVSPNTNPDQKELPTKIKTGENSISPTKIQSKNNKDDEESRIISLEKSINFLRCQHDLMLKNLHQEIENLRRTNKDLQYRIVMCTCAESSNGAKHDTICHTPQTPELENEVQTLKKLLEAEKRRNQTLLAQMEAMNLARRVVTEDPNVKNSTSSASQKCVQHSELEQTTLPTQTDMLLKRSGELAQTDRYANEKNLSMRLERTLTPIQPNTFDAHRVGSPDLKTIGSISTFVPNSRAPLTAPDGLWVRQTVPNTMDLNLPAPSAQQQSSGLAGTKMLPIKLPTLRNGKPVSQIAANYLPKNTLASTVGNNETHVAVSVEQKMSPSLLSNESTQAKAARTARSLLGHNSIAVFDPVNEFSSTHQLEMLRHSGRPYTSNLGPFLPALPKSGDAAQVARQRKARALQRKRLDRVQNMFPP